MGFDKNDKPEPDERAEVEAPKFGAAKKSVKMIDDVLAQCGVTPTGGKSGILKKPSFGKSQSRSRSRSKPAHQKAAPLDIDEISPRR